MNKKTEITILFLAISILFLFFFKNAIIGFEMPTSRTPGWHTTIYPPYYFVKLIGAILLFALVLWRIIFLILNRN